jgi:hypothetical protein
MTVSEYLRRKNNILREYLELDFDLIPEEQIREVEQSELGFDVFGACPYCNVHNRLNSCEGCPMYDAGNDCRLDESTWIRYVNNVELQDFHWAETSPAHKPMRELIEQYNKDIKDKR